MDIHETPLPGVGVRFDFAVSNGRQIGVIKHHTGRRELVVYDRDDPDSSHEVVALEEDESEKLADLLGAARKMGPLADLRYRVSGLSIEWLTLRGESPFINRPMGDTQARTRTGVSIVAVMRADDAFPAPKPDFVFLANDVLVVAGTPNGVTELRQILAG